MNKGPLDISRFEAVETYLLGTMGPDDRKRFEEDLRSDPDLRREVAMQQEHIRAVELGGLQRTLRDVTHADTERTAGRSAVGMPRLLRYAAVVALLLGATVWYVLRPAPNERLFAEHFVTDPGLPVPMSISDDPVFHDAMVAYKLGDYDEARTKWAALLPARPANDTLRYYMGTAALAGGRDAEAVPLLQSVSADGSSVFQRKAQWYLFLAHLRAGDRAAMEAMDLIDDPVYGERARAIMSGMR